LLSKCNLQRYSAGVFVRFLGRLTGLAPPSTLSDTQTAGGCDPEEMFALGQTVLARVVAVDATVVGLCTS
jgi:rRNA biogenesis protein RRP5